MEDLLTVKEVAQKLKLGERAVRELIYTGHLKALKMGEGVRRPVRIKKGDLVKYVSEMTKM